MPDIKVPVFSESVSEGTLLSWNKQPGDAVTRGDILAEIETDKVVLEVTALQDGVLQSIAKQEGDTVLSEEVLGVLGEAGSAPAPRRPPTASLARLPASRARAARPPSRTANPLLRRRAHSAAPAPCRRPPARSSPRTTSTPRRFRAPAPRATSPSRTRFWRPRAAEQIRDRRPPPSPPRRGPVKSKRLLRQRCLPAPAPSSACR